MAAAFIRGTTDTFQGIQQFEGFAAVPFTLPDHLLGAVPGDLTVAVVQAETSAQAQWANATDGWVIQGQGSIDGRPSVILTRTYTGTSQPHGTVALQLGQQQQYNVVATMQTIGGQGPVDGVSSVRGTSNNATGITTVTIGSLTGGRPEGLLLFYLSTGGGIGPPQTPQGMSPFTTQTTVIRAWEQVVGPGATGTRQTTFSPNTGAYGFGILVQRANVGPTAPGTPSVSPNPVNTVGTISWAAATDPDGDAVQYFVDLSTNNGATYSRILNNVTATSVQYDFTNVAATTAARVRVLSAQNPDVGLYGGPTQSATFEVLHNRPPTAPDQLAPSGNASLDRTQAQLFTWRFTDPDAGDAQSRFRLEYRIAGSGAAFTVVDSATVGGGTLQRYTFSAGSLAAGSYEWRVTTFDAAGLPSPVSGSAFFSLANPPAGPTITAPSNGATVQQQAVLTWSFPTQSHYQFRRVGDNAGQPDPAVIYEDSGEVASTSTRDRPLTFAVNNRTEHVQLRVRDSGSGLLSVYSSVRVVVSYTTPTVPQTTTLPVPEQGYLALAVFDPPPPNLFPNDAASSFEDGALGGWVINRDTTAENTAGVTSTLVNSSARAAHGTRSLLLTKAHTTYAFAAAPQQVLTAGQPYTYSAQVFPTATRVDLVVREATGGRTYLIQTATVTPNVWQRVSFTFTPTTTSSTRLDLGYEGNAVPVGSALNVDAVQLERGSAATDYYLPTTPVTVSHDVFRRLATEPPLQERRVATGVGTSWRDYTAASGQAYVYRVVAKAANGTTSSAADNTNTLTLQGVWLHAVDDPQGTALQVLADGHGREHARAVDVALHRFAGRTRPVPEWSPQTDEQLQLETRYRRDQQAQVDKLWALITRRQSLLYRDGRGRRTYVVLRALPVRDELLGQTVTLAFTAVDGTEVV